MKTFITILLILFSIVWLLGRFLPQILVWVLNRTIKKMGVNINDYTQKMETSYSESQKREDKIMDDTVGEYVDFEESAE